MRISLTLMDRSQIKRSLVLTSSLLSSNTFNDLVKTCYGTHQNSTGLWHTGLLQLLSTLGINLWNLVLSGLIFLIYFYISADNSIYCCKAFWILQEQKKSVESIISTNISINRMGTSDFTTTFSLLPTKFCTTFSL